MPILEGKKGTLTARDMASMESIFFARYLDNAQVHRLHFTSSSRTRTRLYKLQEKGAIKALNFRDALGRPRVCWRLTREGFETVAADLDYDERWTPKQLGPERLRHHVATNEVFVAARRPFAEIPSLDDTLGPYPGWEWLHEARAADAYEYAGEEYRYQPDAEVWLCGSLFIVERQTRLSRVSPAMSTTRSPPTAPTSATVSTSNRKRPPYCSPATTVGWSISPRSPGASTAWTSSRGPASRWATTCAKAR